MRIGDSRQSGIGARADMFRRRSGGAAHNLKVSAYDRTSSLIIALLLLVGGTVVGLLVVFFSDTLTRLPPSIPVTPVSAGSRAPSPGEISDTTPGVENAPEQEEDLEELLDQLALTATSDSVLFADQAVADSARLRKGDSGSDSRGTGDSGDGGETDEPQRVIRYEPRSLQEYAIWYDNAGLELAVLGEDNQVYYASNLSQPEPTVRVGAPDDERRLYFNSSGTPLASLDLQLAEKAGIADRGDIILQICTDATGARLLQLEEQAADGRDRSRIARTVFRVNKTGRDRFEFVVEDQTYSR